VTPTKGDGEIKELVMAEVAKQIGPLAKQVDKLGSNIDRLFNTNGGPEGFLQSARREDNTRFENEKKINDGRFDMIFNMFQEFKDDLKPLKAFMRDHLSKEEQKKIDDDAKEAMLAAKVDESERRFKRYMALMTLGLAILMALIAVWDHRAGIIHSLAGDPPSAAHSRNVPPQDSAMPQGYTHP
jgi:hypothetical protein